MPQKPKTVAFVGTGDTKEDNVKALLDDFMPELDADGQELPYNPPIVPDKIRRADKGLAHCADWASDAFGKDVDRLPLDKISQALVDARDDEDDPADVYLVYVPGDADDPHRDEVADALANGIPVLDITQGLHEYELPKVAKSESEPEKPRTRGRARGAEKPSEAPAEPDVQTPAEGAEKPAASTTASPEANSAGGMAVMLSKQTIEAILHAFSLMANDIKDSVVDELPANARPKARMIAAYYNEGEGSYRLVEGRGRPKTGEARVELTVEEAIEAGLDFS
jgi:hypothetical protein